MGPKIEKITGWIVIKLYETKFKGRTIIDLDSVDHTKENIDEALGIKKKLLGACVDYLTFKYEPRELCKKLKFDDEEILKALDEAWFSASKKSEVVTKWWKKRGRKQVTLEEFVGTKLLIDLFGDIYDSLKAGISVYAPLSAIKEKRPFYIS
jgi:hypothetical protein